ncbi:MAG: hypothetical protein ABIJ92_00695 [Candidatus Aenigmatarchaeota archaeon]
MKKELVFGIVVIAVVAYTAFFYQDPYTSIQVTGAQTEDQAVELKQQVLNVIGSKLSSVTDVIIHEKGEEIETGDKVKLVEIERADGKVVTYLGNPKAQLSPIVPKFMSVFCTSQVVEKHCYAKPLANGDFVHYYCDASTCSCTHPTVNDPCSTE